MDKRNTSSATYENIVKAIRLRYSRADTRITTRAVPHDPSPGIAHSSSLSEGGATEGGSAGIPISPARDSGQPLKASPAPPNNGATDDGYESTLLLGDDS